jgi:Ulp1 family protease
LKALYPADGGPGAVEVLPADLVRLQPGEFLNDTIIDFYMK